MTWLLLILAALFGRPRHVPRREAQRVQLAGVESIEAFVHLLAEYIALERPETFDELDAAWACEWLDFLTLLAWRHAPISARALTARGVKPATLSETFARIQAIGAVLLLPPQKRPKRAKPRRIRRRGRAHASPAHGRRALELSG